MENVDTLVALGLAEFPDVLEKLADQMMLEEPRDIEFLRRRKLDTGREFAVWEYTVGYCMNASDILSLLRAQATDASAPTDLSTLKESARRVCDWYAGSFKVTGAMDDAVTILSHCRDLYAEVDSIEQFASLTRATERYLVQLLLWVDRQLPWPAVSDLVHGYRLRTADGPTR